MKPVTVTAIELPQVASRRIDPPAEAGAGDFAASLKGAIDKVDALQIAADGESEKLAGGAGNLHETMLALEKADVAMKVALKVRNKVIDAYNEVMRMTV